MNEAAHQQAVHSNLRLAGFSIFAGAAPRSACSRKAPAARATTAARPRRRVSAPNSKTLNAHETDVRLRSAEPGVLRLYTPDAGKKRQGWLTGFFSAW